MSSEVRGLLVLVVCAASPARHVLALADLLMAQGWRLRVVATPEAESWLDVSGIEALTGFVPAVSGANLGPDGLGHPDAVLVAPATLNTIAKAASCLNDCLALDVIHTAIGDGIPTYAAPHLKAAFALHPGYQASLSVLRGFGVQVLDETAVCEGGCPADRHWPAVASALAGPSPLVTSRHTTALVAEPEEWSAG